jgi:hypothetical protein
MKHSLRTFKQMPTSASRRVWEGKAQHYNRKNVKRAIFVAAPKIADALRRRTAKGSGRALRTAPRKKL